MCPRRKTHLDDDVARQGHGVYGLDVLCEGGGVGGERQNKVSGRYQRETDTHSGGVAGEREGER